MEKLAVIRPDVTPELDAPANEKIAVSDCVKRNIVDNCKATVSELDADFRKKAAAQIAKTLEPHK